MRGARRRGGVSTGRKSGRKSVERFYNFDDRPQRSQLQCSARPLHVTGVVARRGDHSASQPARLLRKTGQNTKASSRFKTVRATAPVRAEESKQEIDRPHHPASDPPVPAEVLHSVSRAPRARRPGRDSNGQHNHRHAAHFSTHPSWFRNTTHGEPTAIQHQILEEEERELRDHPHPHPARASVPLAPGRERMCLLMTPQLLWFDIERPPSTLAALVELVAGDLGLRRRQTGNPVRIRSGPRRCQRALSPLSSSGPLPRSRREGRTKAAREPEDLPVH